MVRCVEFGDWLWLDVCFQLDRDRLPCFVAFSLALKKEPVVSLFTQHACLLGTRVCVCETIVRMFVLCAQPHLFRSKPSVFSIVQRSTSRLLFPIKLLPRRSLHLHRLRPRRTRPPFNSIPHIPRSLTSILAHHSTTASTPTSVRTTRQPSEHAPSPVFSLLLVQTRSLRGTHLLREQVLLVACWVAGGDGGWRVDGAEVHGCGLLWLSGRCGRVGGVGWCEVDLGWRGVHAV